MCDTFANDNHSQYIVNDNHYQSNENEENEEKFINVNIYVFCLWFKPICK